MDFNNVSITLADVVLICSAIVAVGAAIGVIWKLVGPVFKKQKETDARIDRLEENQAKDYAAIVENKGFANAVSKALFVLLEHLDTSGNPEIAKAKNDLTAYFITR